MKENGIPRHGYEVLANGESIGVITTGYYSPTLEKNIGFALIKQEFASLGSEVELQIRKNRAKATVVDKRFYKKNN